MPSTTDSPSTPKWTLPDVNVLVALVHPGHVHHQLAHAWFDGVSGFATTPVTEAGLLRLALNPRIAETPITPSAALASLGSLRADPRACFLADDTSLAASKIDLAGWSGYRQVTDLHLVNLAASADAVLVTFDRSLPAALLPHDRRYVHVIG